VELLSQIVEVLEKKPGSTCREISKLINVHRKEINPILYRHKELFHAGQGETSAPIWFLNSSNIEVVPYQRQTSRNDVSPADLKIRESDEFESIFREPSFDPEVLARFEKTSTSPRPEPEIALPTPDNPLGLFRWQREAFQAWRDNGNRGIIEAVTGSGKTRVGLAAMAEQQKNGGKILVLVPTIVLLYQWQKEVENYFPEIRVGLVGDGHQDNFNRHDVLIGTLATSMRRNFLLGTKSGLVIVDECHRAAAPEYRKALGEQFDYRMGLSATHERMDDEHINFLLPYFNGLVFRLGYERAIQDGVIASVNVTFRGVQFSEEEQAKYIEFQRTLSQLRRKLISKFDCRSAPFSAFLDDVTRLAARGPQVASRAANQWISTWGKKKQLLAETPAKLKALGQLHDRIKESGRVLVFTQTINSANACEDILDRAGIRVALHHSDITSDEREANLAGFSDGSVNCLVTVQTLEEGVDVPNANLGIIVASTKQRRQMIQRMGRVLRRKEDGRDAEFEIIFVELTDEDPRLGAQEAFVTELVDVARSSRIEISA
jgi:RNA polymerase primary sigma factor